MLGKVLQWLGIIKIYDEMQDVRELRAKFDMPISQTPTHLPTEILVERIECMQEELNEFSQGVDKQDLAEMADALIDLVYFAKGTAAMLGLPWEDLWEDVHRANMGKVRGVTKRGHAVDITKPKDWVPPQTETILYEHGYRHHQWFIGVNSDDR
jgi:NTP pyrophosphatase (non-canonical NTP hydrolase)